MSSRPFIIDTDTASDDAVALVMALRRRDVEVKAITVVAGNVPLPQAVQNALYTVDLCGADVPVYAGAAVPLLGTLETAQVVHGLDGMGDIGLPLTGRTPAPGHAVDILIEMINRHVGEITLVSLGPLTNIALALARDPSIVSKVGRYVMMGGTSDAYGNVTAVAEYNIWADPDAAKIVFASGLPIEMVGWDISRKYATFNPAEAANLRAIGTELARFSVDIQGAVDAFSLKVTRLAGFDLPDPIAMAVALDPTVATERIHVYAAVETGGELCRGQTVIDHLGLLNQPPNIHAVTTASRERFVALLREALSDRSPT